MSVRVTCGMLYLRQLGEERFQERRYRHKIPEFCILRHLVVDPICSNGIVGDVLHVRLAEVECSVKYWSCNALDPGMLIPLYFMELVYEPSMMRV